MKNTIFNPRWDDLPHGCQVESTEDLSIKNLFVKGELIGKEFSKISKREYYDNQGRLHDFIDPATNNVYPARLYQEGSYNCFKNGLLHADNRPAIYWKFATGEHIEYRKEGLLHREDGPAKISNAEISFYTHGDCFKTNYPDGRVCFYENGRLVNQVLSVGGGVDRRTETMNEFSDAKNFLSVDSPKWQPNR